MEDPRPIRVFGPGQPFEQLPELRDEGTRHAVYARPRFPVQPRPSVTRADLFTPPSASDIPESLFSHYISQSPLPSTTSAGYRFVRHTNLRQLLIYTDGSCLDNGTVDARGGCSFVFKPLPFPMHKRAVAFALEERGPDDKIYQHTSNRAELRAVTAALQFRAWAGEGFDSLVIATDSEYIVKGITERIETWASNGWRTAKGDKVKNVDLWKKLLELVNWLGEDGVEVLFWHIPRHLNFEADAQARLAAEMEPMDEHYTRIYGILI